MKTFREWLDADRHRQQWLEEFEEQDPDWWKDKYSMRRDNQPVRSRSRPAYATHDSLYKTPPSQSDDKRKDMEEVYAIQDRIHDLAKTLPREKLLDILSKINPQQAAKSQNASKHDLGLYLYTYWPEILGRSDDAVHKTIKVPDYEPSSGNEIESYKNLIRFINKELKN